MKGRPLLALLAVSLTLSTAATCPVHGGPGIWPGVHVPTLPTTTSTTTSTVPAVVETPAQPTPTYEPITARWHVCGVNFCGPDGSIVQWRGLSDFLLYRMYLEQGEAAVRAHLAQRRQDYPQANIERVWLMSRWLDGGEVDEVQLWPQRYGDRFYDSLAPFVRLVGAYGFRVELTVFADAQDIMPNAGEQQRHLDRVFDAVRNEPALGGIEVCNETNRNNANGVDVRRVRPSNPGSVEWATGDYDIENRTDFPHGTYGTYHGNSDHEAQESAKEAHFYEAGWHETRANGSPSFFDGVRIPWVNDETRGMNPAGVNRWGDARENSRQHAAETGAGICVGSAGGTAHGENLLLSRDVSDGEKALLQAFLDGLTWCAPGTNQGLYVHDGAGAWLVPVTDFSSVGEVAGRQVGNQQFLVGGNSTPAWQPQPVGASMTRSGEWGERITLTR